MFHKFVLSIKEQKWKAKINRGILRLFSSSRHEFFFCLRSNSNLAKVFVPERGRRLNILIWFRFLNILVYKVVIRRRLSFHQVLDASWWNDCWNAWQRWWRRKCSSCYQREGVRCFTACTCLQNPRRKKILKKTEMKVDKTEAFISIARGAFIR